MVDYVYDLAFGPDGTAYAARHSGLYRRDGDDWVFAFANLEIDTDEPLVTTAVDIAADGTIFAGGTGGIVRSENEGKSWHISPLPPPPATIMRVAFSPDYERDGAAFAGSSEDGMFITLDRGKSWSRWNFGLLDLNILSIVTAGNDTIYAGTETGLYRSTNGGRAWRDLDFPEDLCPVLSLSMLPSGELLIGTETGGVYRWQSGEDFPVGRQFDAPVNALQTLSDGRVVALLSRGVLISGDTSGEWHPLEIGAASDLIALAASTGEVIVADAEGHIHTATL